MSAISTVNTQDDYWLSAAMEAIGPEGPGVIVVEEVLSAADVSVGQQELEAAFSAMRGEVGDAKLQVAGEHGVARIPMGYRPWFFGLFAIDHVLAVAEETLGDTAICHLQNGFLQRPNLGIQRRESFKKYHIVISLDTSMATWHQLTHYLHYLSSAKNEEQPVCCLGATSRISLPTEKNFY